MPRSRHADAFDHDEEAPGYDRDVENVADPIRAGYGELLDWLAVRSQVGPESRVLELGAGTGNLTARLPRCRRIECVDVSARMAAIAREKLRDRPEIRWVRADLLEYFDHDAFEADAVVSSYAIHHLTDDEKDELFSRIAACLRAGGRIALGDLMFESESARRAILARYRREGRTDLADGIAGEFFWDLERCALRLRDLGFVFEIRRFSDLAWGVAGERS